MFSKAKDSDNQSAQSASQSRRVIKSAPSIISTDLVVHGSLVATGDIQIDGRVEGDIESGSLTVGEKATVHGEVTCEEVVIRGRVIGCVRAGRVHLSGTSHVEGDIYHHSLAVETGAFFEGNCRHADHAGDETGNGRRKSGGKNPAAGSDGGEMRNPAPRNNKGSYGAPPKPQARKNTGSRGRGPVEAQSALSRLTGGSNRKGED